MMPRQAGHSTASRVLLTLFLATNHAVSATLSFHKAGEFLRQGDSDIKKGDLRDAIGSYSFGMRALPKQWSKLVDGRADGEDERQPTKSEIKDIINLHTHYGEARYRENDGVGNEEVLDAFKRAIVCYRDWLNVSPEYYRDDPEVAQTAARPFFFLGVTFQELAERPEYKEKQEEYLEQAWKSFSRVKELDEGGEWTEPTAKSYFFLGITYQELSDDSVDRVEKEGHLEKAVEAYDVSIEMDPDNWEPYASKGGALATVGVDDNGNRLSLQEYEEGIQTWEKALYILTKMDDPEGYASPTASPTSIHKTEKPKEMAAEILFRVGQALIPSLFDEPPTEGEEKDDKEEEKEDYSEKMCKLPGETKEEKCLDLAVKQFQAALKFHPEHEGAKSILRWFQMKDNEAKMAQLAELAKLMEEYEQMKRTLAMMKKVEGLTKMLDELNSYVAETKAKVAAEGGDDSSTSQGEDDVKKGEEDTSSDDKGDSPNGSEGDAPSKDEL